MLKKILNFGKDQVKDLAKDTVKETVSSYIRFYKWSAIVLIALFSTLMFSLILLVLQKLLG